MVLNIVGQLVKGEFRRALQRDFVQKTGFVWIIDFGSWASTMKEIRKAAEVASLIEGSSSQCERVRKDLIDIVLAVGLYCVRKCCSTV